MWDLFIFRYKQKKQSKQQVAAGGGGTARVPSAPLGPAFGTARWRCSESRRLLDLEDPVVKR